MMQALADYRLLVKDEDPVSPWARSRICTAYMKIRTQDKFAKSEIGEEHFDNFSGLRADEPSRFRRIQQSNKQWKTNRCPLYGAGITKADVLEFWETQSFNLQIEERQGNCSACFLKDQTDLSRVLGEPETDAQWWISIQGRYENFGGATKPAYAQLLAERPFRLEIEELLRIGWSRQGAVNRLADKWMAIGNLNRLKLVVAQEDRRLKDGVASFSCSCESAMVQGDLFGDS